MTELERPLRLDAPREEVLAHAAKLVEEAWRSFDRYRPEEPALDERVRELLGAGLPGEPVSVHEALDDAARILDESIAQPRPRYFAFIGSSGLEIGAIGDLLAHTYDINLAVDARAATQIENQAVRWVSEFVGFPATIGAFTSGGTISNVTALAAAREQALPGAPRPRACRDAGSPSTARPRCTTRSRGPWSCSGIGSNNLRDLPIDEARRLRPDALAEALDADIAAGILPVAVVATAGTTLTGAIDPIDEIADVCAERGVWLHVDGAYGMPAAAVPTHAPLFRGIERADSVSVDAHKWLYLPKACGVVLVREHGTLDAGVRARAGLPAAPAVRAARGGHHARVLAAVPGAEAVAGVPGARRAAVPRGDRAEPRARRTCSTASRPRPDDFQTMSEPPQLSIVPIRHAPAGVADLDAHNDALAKAIQQDGRVYLASALIDGHVWLRPCFVNFRTTEDDVRAIVDVARELGERIAGEARA